MPATFFTLKGGDLFASGGAAQHLVKIPEVDKIIGSSNLALYSTASIALNETIQYFMTFDDVIKFIHFGKGLGTISIEGMLFSRKEGDIPGFKSYADAFKKLRGKQQDLLIGTEVFTAVMTASQFTILSDPDTMANFSFSFAIVNHSL